MPAVLEGLGAQVEVRSLARGDYVLGWQTVVERKTVADLHRSIVAGRFWSQMRALRSDGTRPYLLVEGSSLFRGCVAQDAVRGLCLAVIDLGVALIRTEDPTDTAKWLYRLAERRRDGAVRHRPAYAQKPRSPTIVPAEAALAAAPGVSEITARIVLTHFGSLRAICDAAATDLESLPGVGPVRAKAIVALMHNR